MQQGDKPEILAKPRSRAYLHRRIIITFRVDRSSAQLLESVSIRAYHDPAGFLELFCGHQRAQVTFKVQAEFGVAS